MKNLGRALIITGILLQRYAGIPLWLTMCLAIGGFAWMDNLAFEQEEGENDG